MLAVLAIFGSIPGFAQLTRGFISGVVHDATDAVVDGVRVMATNNSTNIQFQTFTNGAGVYRLVALEPGVYTLEFQRTGFESVRVENIQVSTTQEVVVNRTLAVAATVTTIEVAAPPGVTLAKSTPTLDTKLDRGFVANVALTAVQRDVTRLALLAPTVARGPAGSEFSANGQRSRNHNFTIDGVDNNDLTVTLPNNRLIPEAVAEFHVQTAAYSAEFGRNSGAQVSVITRSGGNDLHGEAFDYYNANWMEPVSLLNKRANISETPRFVQNQAGGALGGPIESNRTFFFGLLETNRRREAPDARNAAPVTIPTAAGYAALSSVPLGPGQSTQSRQAVLDALKFLPGVHSEIPRFLTPANVNVNGAPVEVGTALIPLANPHDFWYIVGRIDHRLTDRDSISYRNQIDQQNQPDFASNLGFGSRFSASQTTLGQNHALSYTRTISPRFINEFRAAYARRNLDFPENDTQPTIAIGNQFTIGGLATYPQARVSNTFQWQDVATLLVGRHSFKFGADIRRNRLFNRFGFNSKGTWSFDSLADFLNNRPFSLTQAVNEASFDARQTNQYYFFQDDFKIARNLTLNLGLRYEYSGVPLGFFGAANSQIAATGVPEPVRPDKNNWAPRFGLAYSPGGKEGWKKMLLGDGETVFRGGYGIGYDVLFYNILAVNGNNYPRVNSALTLQPETIGLFPTLAPRQAAVPPFNPLLPFVNSPTDTQNPTTHFYSFSIQRQLGQNYVFEAGYSGSRSYHQIRQGQANPGILTPAQAQTVLQTGSPNSIPGIQNRRLNPAWGSRLTIESTAIGNYNAMFLKFDKRMSRNLMVGANYTWSANMSDNDESLGVPDIIFSTAHVPQDYFNYRNDYGRSIFDRPHRFVVHYTWQLPWSSAPMLNGAAMKHIFRDWQITGFSDWQSGQPFTIRTGVDSGGTGTGIPFRPDYNPGGVFRKDPVHNNLRTFTIPVDGTGIVTTPLTAAGVPLANSMPGGGNLGKNTFRGPGFTQWNFSLMKTINATERWKVQLRSDFVNLFNHRNFGNPNVFMNNPSAFGTNTSDPGNRSILLSLRIRF
ncbi:MAG: carboxypeptidase regulatory-like domain-containing protein [Bryobacteraceae bacterium]